MVCNDDFLGKVSGVLHIGANTGQERDIYRARGLDVLWIEPIPDVFEELVKNISDYPRQKALCALLSDQDSMEYPFHIANNRGASSSIFLFGQHRDIWPDVDYVATQYLVSTRLDTLLQRENVLPSAYPAMVIDVQGAELLVLKGAGQTLREFRFIKAEAADFECYVNAAKLDDLQRYLNPMGFAEISRHKFATHPKGSAYWDVVWEHKPN